MNFRLNIQKLHWISIMSLFSSSFVGKWVREKEIKRKIERQKNNSSRNGKESNCNQANSTRLHCKCTAQFVLFFFSSFNIFINKKKSVEFDFIAVVRKRKPAFIFLFPFLFFALVALVYRLGCTYCCCYCECRCCWLYLTFYTFGNSSGFEEMFYCCVTSVL